MPNSLPHDSSQIVRRGGDQVAFADVHHFFQPTPSHAAGIANVGEGPLATFAAEPLKVSTFAALQAAAVGVDSSLNSAGLSVHRERYRCFRSGM